jgi:hypothetical protein
VVADIALDLNFTEVRTRGLEHVEYRERFVAAFRTQPQSACVVETQRAAVEVAFERIDRISLGWYL